MKIISTFCLLLFSVTLFYGCKKEDAASTAVPSLTTLNVAYGTDPLQQMDIYLPEGRSADRTKVLILVHGGAWASGDKADFASFIDTIKKRLPAYALFNINYRLSNLGANTFPAQELDVKAAVNFIYSKRSEYKVSDNFSMMGASAGGHLSLLQAYKNSSPVKIKTVVDFFGPADMVDIYNNLSGIPPSALATVVGGTPTSVPDLYHDSSPINFTGTAVPTIILQGSADPLVNAVRQSQALRNALQAAGVPVQYVEYAGKGHGDDWDSATFFDAFNNIVSFLSINNP